MSANSRILRCKVAFAKKREFEDAIRLMPADWTPPGEILSEFDGVDGAKLAGAYSGDGGLQHLRGKLIVSVLSQSPGNKTP